MTSVFVNASNVKLAYREYYGNAKPRSKIYIL